MALNDDLETSRSNIKGNLKESSDGEAIRRSLLRGEALLPEATLSCDSPTNRDRASKNLSLREDNASSEESDGYHVRYRLNSDADDPFKDVSEIDVTSLVHSCIPYTIR